ncbi:MAG: hydroxymyristoyl-ACP dehydratase [Xenophilus sp.]
MNAPATLDHAGIAARIPHHGDMCLIDRLEGWDAQAIHCTTARHADPANPLRTAGGLLAPAAIEFAAQAMALHGGLLAADGAQPSAGYIASVRSVKFSTATLHDRPAPLHLHAQRLSGDASQVMYAFRVEDGARQPVAEGRVVVVLNTPLPDQTSSSSTT